MQTQEISPETQALEPGSEEYNALMAEKFDESQTKQVTPETNDGDQRPAWLPEKFKTPEDFAKSYSELERKLSQGGDKEVKAPADQSQEQAKEVLSEAGLNFDNFSNEYEQSGQLSDASYESLAKAGIPRDMVDAYIQGQQAIADQIRTTIINDVGGDEYYEAMASWAADNLSHDELAVYNAQVESGNLAAIRMAVNGLRAQFEQVNGFEPSLIGGGAASATDGFRSTQEMVTAMRDPRYKTDPAYQADVQRRVGLSPNLF